MEKQVVIHAEPAFVTAHALMEELSHPDGPLRNGMARSFVGHGLNELTGVFEVVAHVPPAGAAEVPVGPLEEIRAQLGGALAELLVSSSSLEDSLRVARARDWVAQAWSELELVGDAE